MENRWILDRVHAIGVDFEKTLESMEVKVATVTENNGSNENSREQYIKLNYQRCSRIQKTYRVSEPLRKLIQRIARPQLWMAITEPWCGDSAQTIPYIAAMAALNPQIEFKLISREENPDIMELYLTDGKRSIPKIVAFDEEGRELFQWGPRPAELQKIFEANRARHAPREEIQKTIHLWYARHGRVAIETEFIQILQNVLERTASSKNKSLNTQD